MAQRLPFEQSFDVTGASILDVSTIRGKIAVRAGEPGRIVVAGTVTVRVTGNVPANAADLARHVADHPPVEHAGSTVRLRPPSDDAERRALTVSYEVRVPPDTEVRSVSESGATTIEHVSGAVSVRTQSGAIVLTDLGAMADVTSGSGAVEIDGVAGTLSVTTSSSAFTGRSLQGNLRVRTSSGAVDATLVGPGDIDVETGSSGIELRGASGALRAVSRSGRMRIQGRPARPWEVSAGSSSVYLTIDPGTPLRVDASSGSSVKIVGASVQGAVSKRKVTGTIGESGPLVRVSSRSGSVVITVAAGVVPSP
ncbi:MAG: DUF4097 family beta strand repeat-containing protein [Vicinamibacterales bacterium]